MDSVTRLFFSLVFCLLMTVITLKTPTELNLFNSNSMSLLPTNLKLKLHPSYTLKTNLIFVRVVLFHTLCRSTLLLDVRLSYLLLHGFLGHQLLSFSPCSAQTHLLSPLLGNSSWLSGSCFLCTLTHFP